MSSRILAPLTFILLFTTSALSAQNGNGRLMLHEEKGIQQMQQSYNQKDKKLEGFRVQIYNGRKDACTAKRSEFKKYYPSTPVYTLYESPEYRLQAGDFRTRLEAEKFLHEIETTFSGCFVVKTNIEFPPL